jgi:hypothetical protein
MGEKLVSIKHLNDLEVIWDKSKYGGTDIQIGDLVMTVTDKITEDNVEELVSSIILAMYADEITIH